MLLQKCYGVSKAAFTVLTSCDPMLPPAGQTQQMQSSSSLFASYLRFMDIRFFYCQYVFAKKERSIRQAHSCRLFFSQGQYGNYQQWEMVTSTHTALLWPLSELWPLVNCLVDFNNGCSSPRGSWDALSQKYTQTFKSQSQKTLSLSPPSCLGYSYLYKCIIVNIDSNMSNNSMIHPTGPVCLKK